MLPAVVAKAADLLNQQRLRRYSAVFGIAAAWRHHSTAEPSHRHPSPELPEIGCALLSSETGTKNILESLHSGNWKQQRDWIFTSQHGGGTFCLFSHQVISKLKEKLLKVSSVFKTFCLEAKWTTSRLMLEEGRDGPIRGPAHFQHWGH